LERVSTVFNPFNKAVEEKRDRMDFIHFFSVAYWEEDAVALHEIIGFCEGLQRDVGSIIRKCLKTRFGDRTFGPCIALRDLSEELKVEWLQYARTLERPLPQVLTSCDEEWEAIWD